MCWNKEVSILTLLIGTGFNYLLLKNFPTKDVLICVSIWQYILFMQLFEALSWISHEMKNSFLNSIATYGAFLLNVSQPVFIATLASTIASPPTKWILGILCLIYTGIIVKNSVGKKFHSLYTKSCNHLQLYWWKDWFNPTKHSIAFPLYAIILLLSFLCLKSKGLALFQIIYIAVTFTLSVVLYHCSYGGIWCWFSAFGPLATFLYLKLKP
jgi:hypothetical protein